MALFLFRGPPIYAAGQGANANVTASGPAPSAAMTASALAPIVWSTVPDQVFTQNATASHDLSGYASIAGGYPLRLTLAPGSASLPSGITWNETTKSLVGTNPPTVTTVAGVKLRATSGVLATLSGTLGAPSASLAATATQHFPGTFAAITQTVPPPAGVVAATATQDPPPTGIGYPSTYTVPSDSEYIWSDTSDWDYYNETGAWETHPSGVTHHTQWQVPYQVYAQVYGHTLPHPGWYMRDDDGGLMWKNVGGDWADLNNTAQGSVTFRGANIGTAAHNVQEWFSWNIYNLVSLWLNGTFRNAGFWMRANNTNTTTWASKWDAVVPARTPYPDRRPYLMLTSTSLGQVRVECTRNIGIISSSESTQAGAVTFQTSGTTSAGLVYFDLSPYSAADITGAVFWCLSTDRFGSQTVNIFRCVNPANQEEDHNTPIDSQHVGIAANYPLDVGIENDPKVYFVQKFTSAAIQPNGTKYFDDIWDSAGIGSGYNLTTTANTTAVANGFTPLAGIYNAGSATCTTSGGPSAYFHTGRGHPLPSSGKRLKPYVEVDDMWLRYYVMLGLDWDPAPHPGKFPGFDGRYRNHYAFPGEPAVPTLLGMGRGNSGSGTDGITGWSARANFSRARTPGSPMENLRGLGFSDSYTADMTNFYGGQYPLTNHMLGMLRKGQWHCIDSHCKMNSVTQPAEQPRRVVTWTRSGTVCTVGLQDPEDLGNPLYQVGAIWSSGGGGSIAGVQGPGEWQGPHAITSIIDARTFTYTLASTSAAAPSMGTGAEGNGTGWWIVPGVGNFDGILEGWVNGRYAGGYTGLRYRHSARRPDGGLLGIDGAWFAIFVGGDPAHTYAPVTCYLANIVVASSYVGPLVGYP